MIPKFDDIVLISQEDEPNTMIANFHKACDGKAATLTICKTNYGHTFGFYTDIPWQCDGSGWKKNKGNTFILKIPDNNKPIKFTYGSDN